MSSPRTRSRRSPTSALAMTSSLSPNRFGRLASRRRRLADHLLDDVGRDPVSADRQLSARDVVDDDERHAPYLLTDHAQEPAARAPAVLRASLDIVPEEAG